MQRGHLFPLSVLRLKGNNIGDASAILLSSLLSQKGAQSSSLCHTLTELDLADTSLTSAGVIALLNATPFTSTLKFVDCSGHFGSRDVLTTAASVMSINRSILQLDLSPLGSSVIVAT